MDTQTLATRFARMGARAWIVAVPQRGRGARPLTLDVRADALGEYFDVRQHAQVDLDVVDVRRRERHLLLRMRERQREHFYLCGHDEQHWFAAAIPESAGSLTNVFAAMEALKPAEVLAAQRRQGLKGDARFQRKNAAFVRQGEWFFLPAPKLHVAKQDVVYQEPLSRGAGSKPHMVECLYRRGGEAVHVCDEYPAGLRSDQYLALLRTRPRAKTWAWRRMVRNPQAFVKGKISHPDHKTIELFIWHQVVMNTENQSQAKSHVVFLD